MSGDYPLAAVVVLAAGTVLGAVLRVVLILVTVHTVLGIVLVLVAVHIVLGVVLALIVVLITVLILIHRKILQILFAASRWD